MRRAIGVILVLLGSLLIGIGLLAKPYLYNQLAIAPLDQRIHLGLAGHGHGGPVPARGRRRSRDRQAERGQGRRAPVRWSASRGSPEEAGVEDTDAFWQTTVQSQAEVDGQMVDLSYSDTGVVPGPSVGRGHELLR